MDHRKRFFKYFNKKMTSKQLAPLQDANGSLITDDINRANKLNKYFSSVFTFNIDPPNTNVHPHDRTHNTSSPEVKFTHEVVYKAMHAV